MAGLVDVVVAAEDSSPMKEAPMEETSMEEASFEETLLEEASMELIQMISWLLSFLAEE